MTEALIWLPPQGSRSPKLPKAVNHPTPFCMRFISTRFQFSDGQAFALGRFRCCKKRGNLEITPRLAASRQGVVDVYFESAFHGDSATPDSTLGLEVREGFSWCLWCLFRPEFGAIYAKELKELKRERA